MNAFAVSSSKQKKIYTAMLLLSLAALLVTGILVSIHFQPSETGSFCNINDYWNCDRVNKSIFAEIFGIPVSFLGFGFYTFLTIILVGLLKGFDFSKKAKFLTSSWFFTLTSFVAIATTILLIFQEVPFLGVYTAWGLIKNLIFIVIFLMIFFKFWNLDNTRYKFAAWLATLTLFGLNFSLYLTDIELFVLEGVCIFCMTQQVLILLITGLNLYELKQIKNDQLTSGRH